MLEQLKAHIEALIFAADQPVTLQELQTTLTKLAGIEVTQFEVENHLNDLLVKYVGAEYPFQIVHIANGYQFFSFNSL